MVLNVQSSKAVPKKNETDSNFSKHNHITNKDGPPHNSKKTETKGERNSDSHFGTFLLIFTSIHIHTTHTFTGFGQRGKDDDSEQNERRGHHQNRTDTGI